MAKEMHSMLFKKKFVDADCAAEVLRRLSHHDTESFRRAFGSTRALQSFVNHERHLGDIILSLDHPQRKTSAPSILLSLKNDRYGAYRQDRNKILVNTLHNEFLQAVKSERAASGEELRQEIDRWNEEFLHTAQSKGADWEEATRQEIDRWYKERLQTVQSERATSGKELRQKVDRLNKEFLQATQSEKLISGEELQQDPQGEPDIVSERESWREQLPPPPLEDLRYLLQSRFPVLYEQVLEPTLADLRYEHSAALSQGHPGKAHWILLRGCCALAAAAIRQLGFSLLDRIAAFWRTRSLK